MNKRSISLGIAALFTVAGLSHAGPVGPLTTFTAGTSAKASEVNGNFSAVSTAVNDNSTRITTLEGANAASRLGALETTITTLQGANTASRLTALETTVTPAGNIVLVPSTATAGTILRGTARFMHTFGIQNTFIGENVANFTMSGGQNTASGAAAFQNNTTGSSNTANGVNALQGNTTGFNNTASGVVALQSNSSGFFNTASGSVALSHNTTGNQNTASGVGALENNETGSSSTADGVHALANNTTGNNNTASGRMALFNNTTGSNNIAVGINAGINLTTGDNNIGIGNPGVAGEAGTVRIGTSGTQTAAFIAGIRGVTTVNNDAIPVMIDSAGQFGTLSSSRRVKDDIADMDKTSETLMRLRPVTFYYKNDKNPKGRTLQYGLVAEEVAGVAPGLVARSADGRIETVYYQFLAPMLLNEYQKQQRTIAAQAAELTEQKLEIAELRQQTARIAELEKQASRMAGLLGRLEAARVASAGR